MFTPSFESSIKCTQNCVFYGLRTYIILIERHNERPQQPFYILKC